MEKLIKDLNTLVSKWKKERDRLYLNHFELRKGYAEACSVHADDLEILLKELKPGDEK